MPSLGAIEYLHGPPGRPGRLRLGLPTACGALVAFLFQGSKVVWLEPPGLASALPNSPNPPNSINSRPTGHLGSAECDRYHLLPLDFDQDQQIWVPIHLTIRANRPGGGIVTMMTPRIRATATVTEPANAVTGTETSQRATVGVRGPRTGTKTVIVIGDDPEAPNPAAADHTTGDDETRGRRRRRSLAETGSPGARTTTQKKENLRGAGSA